MFDKLKTEVAQGGGNGPTVPKGTKYVAMRELAGTGKVGILDGIAIKNDPDGEDGKYTKTVVYLFFTHNGKGLYTMTNSQPLANQVSDMTDTSLWGLGHGVHENIDIGKFKGQPFKIGLTPVEYANGNVYEVPVFTGVQ